MRRMKHDDRGAVTVAFGLIIALVVLPLLALVADSGVAWFERRQLQNGADAAALAVAFDCARAVTNSAVADRCTTTAGAATAAPYARWNDTRDGNSVVTSVEPAGLSPTTGEVTVATASASDAGAPVPLLLGLLLSAEERDALTFGAAATAAWGGAASGNSLPFIVPYTLSAEACPASPIPATAGPFRSWDCARRYQQDNFPTFVNAQGLIPEGGPYPSDPRRAPVIVQNDDDHPSGSFGWLSDSGPTTCSASLSIYEPATSNGNNSKCNRAELISTALNQDRLLALFEQGEHWGNGSNAKYEVYGFTGIRVTGWNFSGNRYPNGAGTNWESGQPVCKPGYWSGSPSEVSNSDRCFRGWLVAMNPGSGGIGGPSVGVQNVQLTR
jgi:Flp pilus assembly protein TadG